MKLGIREIVFVVVLTLVAGTPFTSRSAASTLVTGSLNATVMLLKAYTAPDAGTTAATTGGTTLGSIT